MEKSSPSEADRQIIIGRVGAPHGVKGEVKIIPMTDFPERFDGMTHCFIGDAFVNITGVDMSTTAYVSGFVAVVSGGTIDNSVISDQTKLRNNISALNINIKGVGTVYVGGYAASVEQGGATFSFGIANGSISIEDCGSAVVVGLLVGRAAGECNWNMALSSDYFYDIDIITHENGVRIVTTIEKPSDDDEDDRKNLVGNQ